MVISWKLLISEDIEEIKQAAEDMERLHDAIKRRYNIKYDKWIPNWKAATLLNTEGCNNEMLMELCNKHKIKYEILRDRSNEDVPPGMKYLVMYDSDSIMDFLKSQCEGEA